MSQNRKSNPIDGLRGLTTGTYNFKNSATAIEGRHNGIRDLHRDNMKKVIDLNSKVEYPSIGHVALATGLSRCLVHKIIHERPGYEEYKGYKFRFK